MIRLEPLRARQYGWIAALLLSTLVGCAGREVAGTFRNESPPPFSASGQEVVPDRWWVTFDDPGLNRQINEALDNNFTLAAALDRLSAARALTRREASDLWPDVDGVAEIASVFGPGRDRTSYTLGLDTSYQVDLWGQIESRVQAERLRASATRADYHAIALTLSAEIARTWFSLIEARAQLALVEEQIDTNRNGVIAQELKFGAGEVGGPDVLRQRQLVESTLEQSVVVRARIEVLEHQLAVLLGELPQQASYYTGAELPALPPLPDTGLPSELLQRRPDVRRDYLAFMAADRDLASAISAQYPRLNLSASVLNIAEKPETLFRDWFVAIGGQLIAPLFDGGQRRAEVDRTAALLRQRFNEYGETMLTAFREVEDNLALERNQLQRLKHLELQSELARQASDQLRRRYLFREADYLDVLSATTAEQRLQRETLAARLELLLIRVSLYLALAGDFDTQQTEQLELPASAVPVDEAVGEGVGGARPEPLPEPASELEELLRSVEPFPAIDGKQ
ncbi:Toluene efflux pump outer membrane protein TtgI precursor [Stieleria maiorica]|uniref:Toluene efflux pump outer membrane protein TtgI n=1 Tax=Stieleria maiorica TaxID=2795974 RepID=A0A5B9MGN7_9BACT|nr:efflux transporter outer membrane subunit [Stieleria maiorica]QEG00442.1 Toluene efflux pump outer membrane protein TtgI precursor [Stieleria maiorica]